MSQVSLQSNPIDSHEYTRLVLTRLDGRNRRRADLSTINANDHLSLHFPRPIGDTQDEKFLRRVCCDDTCFWQATREQREEYLTRIIEDSGGAEQFLSRHPNLIKFFLESFVPQKIGGSGNTSAMILRFYDNCVKSKVFQDSYQLAVCLLALMKVQYNINCKLYKGDSHVQFGFKLKDFLIELGATKLAQKLDSYYRTPAAWKKGLSRSKDQAEPMSREDFISFAGQVLPADLFNNSTIGELIGSGTYLDTREIFIKPEYRSSKRSYEGLAADQRFVLQLVKPNQLMRSNVVLDLAEKLNSITVHTSDPLADFLKVIRPILEHLDKNIEEEINMELAAPKAKTFSELYDHIKIKTPNLNISYQTPRIFDYGRNYRVNLLLEGQHFADLPGATKTESKHKKEISVAILMTELYLIFSGKAFDHDRHDKNQKIKFDGNNVVIGNFDENGLVKPATLEQKKLLANLCMDAVEQCLTKKQKLSKAILEVFSAAQERPDAINESEQDYIRTVADAVLSLMNYTKIFAKKDYVKATIKERLLKIPRLIMVVINIIAAIQRTGSFDPDILAEMKRRYSKIEQTLAPIKIRDMGQKAGLKNWANRLLFKYAPQSLQFASSKWHLII